MEQARCLQLSQLSETPVRVRSGRAFACRYAYARSADTRRANDIGQDYVAFRQAPQSFAFALCDGVSLSFYGDLAARFLGSAVLAWLDAGLPSVLDCGAIRAALATHLQASTGPATEEVQCRPLPGDIPAMLRDVLEEKRSIGSESTFVCGRLDLPGQRFPEGRIVLAWMGDSRLRLWGPAGDHGVDRLVEVTGILGEEFRTEQRWSSRCGPVGGEPHVFAGPLERDGRRLLLGLMAYSDGLKSLDRFDRSPSSFALQELITHAGEAADSDDISFLEVWLGGHRRPRAAVTARPPRYWGQASGTIGREPPDAHCGTEAENVGSVCP